MDQITTFFNGNYHLITIVILSIFLGIEVISRVPAVLHTPLMSGANAIHGVVIIGAIIVMGSAHDGDYISMRRPGVNVPNWMSPFVGHLGWRGY